MRTADAPAAGRGMGLLWVAVLYLFAAILWHASAREDAYITFRVVDNFVHGFGLRWNIDERVQVYTHPLWLFLHIPFYWLWENIFFVTLFVSLACTAAAVILSIRTFSRPPLAAIALFVLPLLLSKTFVDYSTSGLENPLTHALFAWFGWVLLKTPPGRFWFWLSFTTALALLNRLDMLFFYAPAWLWLLARHRGAIKWKQLIIGALPIIGWELFSLFYYGFLFPNTKYAKLNTGIAESKYIQQGISYLFNLGATDIVGAVLVLGAIFSIPFLWRRYRRENEERLARIACVALGILGYTLYVIYVGGAHTYGRFWTLPVFAAAWVLLAQERLSAKKPLVFLLASLLALAALVPPAARLQSLCPSCFRYVVSGQAENQVMLVEYWRGRQQLPRPRVMNPNRVLLMGSIGIWGFAMEPQVLIVDPVALADPLLARLPVKTKDILGVGVFFRALPAGYFEGRANGDMKGMDPDLALYYAKLRLIVSGPLFSSERLMEIVKFNLGFYDGARAAYLARNARQPISRRENPSGQSMQSTAR